MPCLWYVHSLTYLIVCIKGKVLCWGHMVLSGAFGLGGISRTSVTHTQAIPNAVVMVWEREVVSRGKKKEKITSTWHKRKGLSSDFRKGRNSYYSAFCIAYSFCLSVYKAVWRSDISSNYQVRQKAKQMSSRLIFSTALRWGHGDPGGRSALTWADCILNGRAGI